MPQRPSRPCAKPGCPHLAVQGHRYCEKHLQYGKAVSRQYDAHRPSSNARGYSYRWQQYTKRYLAENPYCVLCLRRGSVHTAKHVDHIQPVTGPDDPLFWDETNHQSLCHSCHSAKTRRETNAKRA